MSHMRFILIGGFLGAGKTTTIARLARAYQRRGLNVGIVTNDQATDLVDTQLLRSQGFDVGEVAGSCFCCNFGALTSTVERLEAARRPDIVLSEPVGSCTDIVATVVQPLVRLYAEQYDVAPYGVIVKPSHGRKILGGSGSGFSSKAAYIFQKQIEEADFAIINRIDELSPAECNELAGLLEKFRPGLPVVRLSAKTGEGYDGLLAMLEQRGEFGRRILELDYDIYADGEAELGWLNSSLKVTADKAFDLDALLLAIVRRLREVLSKEGAETAHLKTIGLWEGFFGVANLIASDLEPELSLPSHCRTNEAEIVVNARVAIAPETLQQHVEQAVREACQAAGGTAEFRQTQSFRPGRPVPTHRYEQAFIAHG